MTEVRSQLIKARGQIAEGREKDRYLLLVIGFSVQRSGFRGRMDGAERRGHIARSKESVFVKLRRGRLRTEFMKVGMQKA